MWDSGAPQPARRDLHLRWCTHRQFVKLGDEQCGPHFGDVAQNFYAYAAIETCYHHGVVNGIALTQVPLCPAPYADVPNGYYARAEIAALTCSGIVAGTDNTHFAPNANASRIQFAKLITLALGWQLSTPTQPSFTDVPATNPLYAYVETAHAHAAIQGGTQADCAAASATYPCFIPNQSLTRAQAALILQRAYAWTDDTTGGPHFSDVPADHFAYAAVETCYQHAVISGVGGGQFAPAASITRGQIAVILYKALTLP